MLKNNIDLGAGVNLFSSGDEDDIIILDNNKLLYTDVLRLVIADYLQYSEPGGVILLYSSFLGISLGGILLNLSLGVIL